MMLLPFTTLNQRDFQSGVLYENFQRIYFQNKIQKMSFTIRKDKYVSIIAEIYISFFCAATEHNYFLFGKYSKV